MREGGGDGGGGSVRGREGKRERERISRLLAALY